MDTYQDSFAIGKTMPFIPDAKLVEAFRNWLDQFDPQHRRSWERTLSADPEPAVLEAAVWHLLTNHGVSLTPNLDLTGKTKSPDFACAKSGEKFFAEVTCIKIATADSKTELKDLRPHQLTPFRLFGFNDAVFQECRNPDKLGQCGAVDEPCLLIVGTFHPLASMICIDKKLIQFLLTGEPQLAWDVDPTTAESDGPARNITELWSAAFVRPGDGIVEPARCPISAVLVVGLGNATPKVLGLLHPKPAHQFERALLPEIEFCHLSPDFASGSLLPIWG